MDRRERVPFFSFMFTNYYEVSNEEHACYSLVTKPIVCWRNAKRIECGHEGRNPSICLFVVVVRS